ncbi:MAG: nuclear transport factor 2 family protein [Wenzhouxiangellaceae bacterium]|nr:nuclear transport factor 2 family protein [Wenzhouxiangellaceae bacterium]
MVKFTLITASALLLAGIAVLVWLFAAPGQARRSTIDYHAALAQFPGSEAGIESGLHGFRRVFSHLTDPAIDQHIRSVYAPTMYFNDALKTYRDHDRLADYMAHTASRLASSSLRVDQVIRDQADVYLRWTMHFESQAAGRSIRSESIGMTHLRFDADGRIVLHQDFWDSASGLYRHLPVIGPLMRRIDSLMYP